MRKTLLSCRFMVLHMKYFFFPQCVLILSREPRRSPWRWRDQCACPPRFCASPPGRHPVERVPRPGIDFRCASTSASSICTVPLRLSSRLYPFVLYTLHAFNLFAYCGLLESVTGYYEAQLWAMDLSFNGVISLLKPMVIVTNAYFPWANSLSIPGFREYISQSINKTTNILVGDSIANQLHKHLHDWWDLSWNCEGTYLNKTHSFYDKFLPPSL